MAKRRGPKRNSIALRIGDDPDMWRFASLQEALNANTSIISQLIKAGEAQEQSAICMDDSSEPMTESESA